MMIGTSDHQDNNIEFQRNKKLKQNNPETEPDYSCFVAHVTASSLETDALYLPQDFTSSNDLKRKSCKIVLKDEEERSWAMDLRFNKGSDTCYISRGWKHFCDENGKNEGSVFTFKLMSNGETPLLSVLPIKSDNGRTQGDKNSSQSYRDSTSPNHNRFVTLTLTNDSLKSSRVYLPLPFVRENGMNNPRMVTLLGKDGVRWTVNLLRESSGRMSLGKGMKDFSKANGLKIGESFTMELKWENATPVLSLFCKEYRIPNKFVTLTLTHDSLNNNRLGLPLSFMRENNMNKPGTMTLLGKDGTKWIANLLQESRGRMSLGKGWREFAIANGLEIGVSFTLESIWEDATPMLSLFSIVESTSDKRQQGECCSNASEEEKSIST
ncbi:B3 domain-containing protein REM12-like isoform X1 [Capsella rubella]|uniref:B3 domain-containing protein REM12-like isoform X1 n=1 Tax=Capsella rubella TaxID=81985 RepID=UPI000CD4E920|nr:B3 domain-containing protein REM12-like isoform X1 [Capsella rubella]